MPEPARKNWRQRVASYALSVRDSANVASGSRTAEAPGTVDPIIHEARIRWARCAEAEDAQRKSILEAKKFRSGDQWPTAIKLQREGATALQGQPAQPPRPCLTVDRLSPAVRQVSNQIKAANFAIDVLPNGHGADDETAKIFKGILRRMQNAARGESPVEWAADQAVEGGLGWFRLRTEFVHETWDGEAPDEALYDQELRLERISNNLSVYCDPSAVKPTRSDALFKFVTEDVSKDEFKSRWPTADLRGIEDFAATGDMKGWASDDQIRIAEYWTVTYDDTAYHQLADGSIVTGTLPDGQKAKQSRVVRKPVVKGYKITSVEVLEQWDWLGSRIPLIPITGEELNVDGKPVLRGIIQEGMDAQRMVNYTYSGAMEIFALGPKSPYVVAEGQLEGYESIWQTANTYNYSYLPYKAQTIQGQPVPPPERQTAEPPIQAAVLLMAKSEEAIKATTNIFDPGLGQSNPREKSGRAIQALQGQSDLANSNFSNNVGRALIYAGELALEIIPKITRTGQILQILGVDDEPEQVMVGVPFQKGPQGPQPVQATPEQIKAQDQRQKGMAKFYDLKAGRYAVTVSVGKSSATKREEGAAALGELIPHLPPEMAAVATPDFVEQLSFEGSHKIAERLRKVLPPHLQEDEQQGAPDPEKQQLQQMVQQLQQALEGKHAEEAAKQEATTQRELQKTQMSGQFALQQAQMDAQLTLQKAQLDSDTRIEVARINAQASLTEAEIKAGSAEAGHQIQREEALIARDQALGVQARDHDHDREMAAVTHEQGLEAGEVEHGRALEAGEQGHRQALEQQAAKPTPTKGENA